MICFFLSDVFQLPCVVIQNFVFVSKTAMNQTKKANKESENFDIEKYGEMKCPFCGPKKKKKNSRFQINELIQSPIL